MTTEPRKIELKYDPALLRGAGTAMSQGTADPRPGQFWSTPKGRTVEIVARRTVESLEEGDDEVNRIDVIAYVYRGGSMVHLRPASSVFGWREVDFE